jgi:hypothetical protein
MRRCGIRYCPSSPVLALGGTSQPMGKRRLAFEGGYLRSSEMIP